MMAHAASLLGPQSNVESNRLPHIFVWLLVLLGLGHHAPCLVEVSLYKINDTCCPIAVKGAVGASGFSRLL
jgi:hypothetical protein